MGRGVTGKCDFRALTLARTGSARQLQISLQHLRNAVHSTVPKGAAAGQDRKRIRAVAVDAAVLDETMGFTRWAQAEHFEPEVDERRKAVVELRQVDLGRPHAGA